MKHVSSVVLILLLAALTLTGAAAAADDTRTFTDDFGRTVVLPQVVDKVIPSGNLALSVFIAFDADYLASSGSGFPASAEKYLPKFYAADLPKTGALFASANTLNYEEVMRLSKLGVDAYVDVGQAKAGISESLDSFTNVTGLAGIFISQNSLEQIPASYRKIGEILGDTERGEELYTYFQGWVDTFNKGLEGKKKVSAAQVTAIEGNSINLMGGFNEAKTLGYQGTPINTLADNIVVAKGNKGTGDEYVMEEAINILTAADPEVIFVNGAADHAYYTKFIEAFPTLSAVKNGRVYEIPADCPYIWTSSPFSGWGICGMIWMANILYPDTFNYDVKDKIQEFYRVVIGYNLTDEEYAKLTEKSAAAKSASAKTPAPVFGIAAALIAAGLFAALRRR
ncbi:MAG TPA: ABC transporter substrate-binding protein [Methanocorpusculum sp.]|nr:ABC transporter substrate-binding protein [Methanocorpusculum sp.]